MIERLKRVKKRLTKPRPSQLRSSEQAARRHSRVVGVARSVLPGIGMVLVLGFAFSAQPAKVDEAFPAQFAYLDQPNRELQMEQPRYSGEDQKGRSYEIVAAKARQNPDTPDLITLDALDGIRSANQEDQMKIKADTGLFNSDEQKLDLSSNIELQQGIGGRDYILKTNEARVALENRTLVSEAGVQGANEDGSFTAERMTVYQQEGKVVLEDVRMRFENKRKDKNGSEADEKQE